MTRNVCDAFKEVEEYLPDNFLFEKDHDSNQKYNTYCQNNKKKEKGECQTIAQAVNGTTLLLLNNLFNGKYYKESENENNEYITYIMLWLSNKMKLIKKGSYGSVGDFYVTFIDDNTRYNKYINNINSKKKIMRIKINEMRKLYELLNELCNAITKHTTDPLNCSNFSKFVNDWIKLYIQLVLKKKKFFEDEYYCNVLVTLKNAYEKFKKDNDTKKNFPEIIEIEKIKTCEELGKEATSSSKVLKVEFNEVKTQNDLEKGKDTSRHIDFKNAFEIYSSFFSIMFTNIRDNLYENVFPTLKNFYGRLKNYADITISYMNEQLKKTIETPILDNCMPEKKETGGEPSSSQENPSDSSDPSEPSSLSGPKEQIATSQLSMGTSEKGNLDQRDQGSSQNPVSRQVTKPENAVSEVAGGGTTEIGDNPLNVYKKMGISILILLIPIALVIMYKYLPFGWRKKSKKKKKMKKAINMFGTNEMTENVINPTDRKKQMQIIINLSTQNKQGKKFINSSTPKKQDKQFINSSTPKKQDKKLTNSCTPKKQDKQFINSSTPKKQNKQFISSSTQKKHDKKFINSSTQKKQDKKFIDLSTQKKQDKKFIDLSTQKKQAKHFINSIYWEKYPLLNIYKLMKADPVPFIILFLLFIFYVYKRKGDSLE
ncbi:YIR protein [Plasmodium yoelii]|uniref:YIR protein n=1 Tax=Plasmodium yoelii TaxID=5861 RepID=A0A077Y7F2_PLAYE|nr:YIR protein [Plasmodium yoelii]